MSLLHQVIEYVITALLELKARMFAEVGFVSGWTISLFTNHQIPSWLHMPFLNTWISQSFIEGIVNGFGGAAGALCFAIVLKLLRMLYLVIIKKYGKRRAN